MTLRKIILVSAAGIFAVLAVVPAGLTLSTNHVVTVQNEAKGELTNLTIHTRWFDYSLGDLGSGEQVQESLINVPEGAM